MANSKTMAGFAHSNHRGSLFLMLGEIKEMIASRNDKVLGLVLVRDLDDGNLERLKIVLRNLESILQQAGEEDGEKMFSLGIEEICDCPIHQEHMKSIGIITLADFFWPEDPERLLTELFLAEMEAKEVGSARQPQLFTRMLSKIALSIQKTLTKKKVLRGENPRST